MKVTTNFFFTIERQRTEILFRFLKYKNLSVKGGGWCKRAIALFLVKLYDQLFKKLKRMNIPSLNLCEFVKIKPLSFEGLKLVNNSIVP
jgi:hypothetical protein